LVSDGGAGTGTNVMFAIGVQHEAFTVHLPLYPLPHIHTACMREDKDSEKNNFECGRAFKTVPLTFKFVRLAFKPVPLTVKTKIYPIKVKTYDFLSEWKGLKCFEQ
jgi:hypothetical protein